MTATADQPPIVLDHVRFGYTATPVVEGVSLTVESGDFLGIVGPNGSGKSTLLDLMLGLRAPDRGEVRLFGEQATEFGDGTRIGYVPQDAAAVPEQMPLTVREVVEMGRYPHRTVGRFSRTDTATIEEAIEAVDVGDITNRRISTLSGGQRQRVFIARALAAEADLLALDEPTVGIDAEARDAFYELLSTLHDSGLTICLIEHDLGAVTRYATEVACIDTQLYFHGDPAELLATDALADAYGTEQRLIRQNA